MPEPREHTEHRNWIETVLRHIPGFRGYLEKEYRRDSDDLQRQWLTGRLRRSKRALDEVSRPLADAGHIDLLPQVDRLRGKLDRLIGRIGGAMEGYSGFFDLVRIDEAVLDRVYEHDVKAMDRIDQLAEAVEGLAAQPDRLGAMLPDLFARVEEAQRHWDRREDILKGLD